MKTGLIQMFRTVLRILIGIYFCLVVLACAVETKQDREFVKSGEEPKTESSTIKAPEQIQPLQAAQSPAPNQTPSSIPGTSVDGLTQPNQTSTTNPMLKSQDKSTGNTSTEKTGAKGTCAEGKVLGDHFTVNTESGVNIRRDANASSERIGGFANGTQLQSWKAKDTAQSALPAWQCVTGKDADGKEITGWVVGIHLKP